MMIEFLWHGRGGQGAFTAARLLGAAASTSKGTYALAFPSFGPERRGAPMRAFTKIADRPIGDRSAVTQADYVIYLDETLLQVPSCFDELKPGGIILVNAQRTWDDDRIISIDADGISQQCLGRPFPNTACLAALTACDLSVSLDQVKDAFCAYMPKKLHKGNVSVMDATVQAMKESLVLSSHHGTLQHADTNDANASSKELCDAGDLDFASDGSASSEQVPTASNAVTHTNDARALSNIDTDSPHRRPQIIPQLTADTIAPVDYAHSTCYKGGHLTVRNAGWRNQRPIIDAAACTGCLQCYLYCPDGTIFKTTDEFRSQASDACAVAIDYDFCKGCGICAHMCKAHAISMVPEKEVTSR
jgi:pyruvate ferredoxin oxidoreductase gamma subunit